MADRWGGKVRLALALAVALLALAPASIRAGSGEETQPERDRRMAWWREARFGMFIHWGVYSLPGRGEWVMHSQKIPLAEYEKLVPQFNPVKFNAREWVQLAKDAGQRYIVMTSKHHDGFCMFDSKLTDYDIMSTPFRRDVLKELADECHRQGMRICWYHSVLDWHHPDYLPRCEWDERPTQNASYDRYIEHMKGQLRELLTGYGRIGVLWFDGGWEHSPEEHHADEVVELIRSLQPGIIINNRTRLPQDFDTPEQRIPPAGMRNRDWETCMTINHSWGYNQHDRNHKSVSDLIRKLAEVASKGGNSLLNVGPRPDGTIQPEHAERLRAVGRWLEANGESIYGTTAGPFKRLPWGRCTAKPGRLYLHVFEWPEGGPLLVPGLLSPVETAYLLTDPAHTPLEVSRSAEGVLIPLPAEAPDPADTVIVLQIEGEPDAVNVVKPGEDGTVALKAVDATLHGRTFRIESRSEEGDIGYWMDPEDWVEWDFKVNAPGRFAVHVAYSCTDGTGGSEYAVLIGGQEVIGKVRDTGSWDDFITEQIGTVDLGTAGTHKLVLRPVEMPHHAVMNLEAVVLKPMGE